jgi:hypothetical protein
MTDEELKALAASLAVSHQRVDEQQSRTDAQLALTDAQLAKTDAQLARTDAKVQRLAELMGQFANNQGDIAEEFFYRSLERNPRLGGLRFDRVYRNLTVTSRGLQGEFDIVLANGDSVAVVEVKSKAHPSEIDKLVDAKIPRFKQLFPHYAGLNVYGALASLASNSALEARAKARGVFFITQQGRHIALVQSEAPPL